MNPDEALRFLTEELLPKVSIKEMQYKQIALMTTKFLSSDVKHRDMTRTIRTGGGEGSADVST